jgi:hypothetical protein
MIDNPSKKLSAILDRVYKYNEEAHKLLRLGASKDSVNKFVESQSTDTLLKLKAYCMEIVELRPDLTWNICGILFNNYYNYGILHLAINNELYENRGLSQTEG